MIKAVVQKNPLVNDHTNPYTKDPEGITQCKMKLTESREIPWESMEFFFSVNHGTSWWFIIWVHLFLAPRSAKNIKKTREIVHTNTT